MNVRSMWMIVVAAVFAFGAAAQDNCPKEMTLDVPANVTYGPIQNCGNFGYQLPGISVTTIPNGCPLHLIYTPLHQVAVPSKNNTLVLPNSVNPIKLVTFVCESRWLLIIPIGSRCVQDREINLGTVPLLYTAPCAQS